MYRREQQKQWKTRAKAGYFNWGASDRSMVVDLGLSVKHGFYGGEQQAVMILREETISIKPLDGKPG